MDGWMDQISCFPIELLGVLTTLAHYVASIVLGGPKCCI